MLQRHLVNPGLIPGLDPFPSRIMTNLNSEEGTNFFFLPQTIFAMHFVVFEASVNSIYLFV